MGKDLIQGGREPVRFVMCRDDNGKEDWILQAESQ
jgi:hypothetical protein